MSADLFDTIVAPATPLARSALAMLRLDGPLVPNILLKLTTKSLEPRRATRVTIRDRYDEIIDEAVVTLFPAPDSFTGNHIAEISLHGSPFLVERCISEAVHLGARLAEPGEFSERAVLNGKIDLLQAEAIVDLIESRSVLQASLALSHLGGSFSRAAEEIRGELLELLTLLEGALDFADEGYEFIQRAQLLDRLKQLSHRLESLAGTFVRGRAVREGIRLVLLGQPNAGKSTLLNLLVGSDRAIVTSVPGTTRDLLRETIVMAGLPVTVVDTAGLRQTEDLVEGIGVERAHAAAAEAEIVLYLVDARFGVVEADRQELTRHPGAFILYTKRDVADPPEGSWSIAATTGDGLDDLLTNLSSVIRERFDLESAGPAITNHRQLTAVELGREAVESAIRAAESGSTEEFLAADLYRAAAALEALTGAISAADARAEVFSRFCIGK